MKERVPLVDTEVRRSSRLQGLTKGSKKQSICVDKNCMACNVDPPFVADKIVKNLTTTFC